MVPGERAHVANREQTALKTLTLIRIACDLDQRERKNTSHVQDAFYGPLKVDASASTFKGA